MLVDVVRSIHTVRHGRLVAGSTVELDDADRYVRAGYVVPAGEEPDTVEVWDDPTRTPARSASVGVWLAYARLRGYTGPDDVTRKQLIADYGEPATR